MAVDEGDRLDLTERLVSPSEMAQIMGVDEADVLAWIESGELAVQRGADGEPWVSIREHREIGRSADDTAGFEAGSRSTAVRGIGSSWPMPALSVARESATLRSPPPRPRASISMR
jgi:hypothetical protein